MLLLNAHSYNYYYFTAHDGPLLRCVLAGAKPDARDGQNAAAVSRFGVDGIPHLALVSAGGIVVTALIGQVSAEVKALCHFAAASSAPFAFQISRTIPITQILRADFDALIEEKQALSSISGQVGAGKHEKPTFAGARPVPYLGYDAFENDPGGRDVLRGADRFD